MVVEKAKKPPPLPVSAVVDTMKKGKQLRCLFPAVQLVCVWALLTACAIAGTSIYNLAHQSDPAPSKPAIPSPWVTTIELTGAEAIEVSSINGGQLWCSAPQAAAAALALLVPADRPGIRRALAFVALGATAAVHYMYARLLGILLVPSPGNATLTAETVAVFVSGVADVLFFLALLLGEDEEEGDPEE